MATSTQRSIADVIYNIAWTVLTLRANQETEKRLLPMSASELERLALRMLSEDPPITTQNDAWRWLNDWGSGRECPACTCVRSEHVVEELYRCASCRALYGSCSLRTLRFHVKAEWHDGPPESDADGEKWTYYDVYVTGYVRDVPGQVYRVHGYYHADSHKLLQVG